MAFRKFVEQDKNYYEYGQTGIIEEVLSYFGLPVKNLLAHVVGYTKTIWKSFMIFFVIMLRMSRRIWCMILQLVENEYLLLMYVVMVLVLFLFLWL